MSDLHKSFIAGLKKPSAPGKLPLLSESDAADAENDDTGHDNCPASSNETDRSDDTTLWDGQMETQHKIFDIIEDIKAPHETGNLRVYFKSPLHPTSPLIFGVHGAGSSSMTFAMLASQLRTVEPSIGICCYDLRGHGDSLPTTNYSMDAFVADTDAVVKSICCKHGLVRNPCFFLGHSLGGAILSAYLSRAESPELPMPVGGLILLDIVQDTAVKSLSAMPSFIKKRPVNFRNLQEAIDWHIGLLLFNKASAELSIPHLLHQHDLKWKTDLALTQPYWAEWFGSLSLDFLGYKGPKLLILSTHEALDKDLIVGQMQGRYQLVAFNNNHRSGHFIQEDLPGPVSACILDFIKRNNSPEKFMRENLGIVPKWGGAINK